MTKIINFFRDGVPYCEKDYQKQFGVKCAYCNRYISGKVLQAGENHHFHPTCARCTKCGDPFGDGEEMYLQGAAIWHPRCGPGPTGSNGIVNGHGEPHTPQHRESERISSSASEMQVRNAPKVSLFIVNHFFFFFPFFDKISKRASLCRILFFLDNNHLFKKYVSKL